MLFDLQIFSGGVYPPSATSRTISFSISNSFWYEYELEPPQTSAVHQIQPRSNAETSAIADQDATLDRDVEGSREWREECEQPDQREFATPPVRLFYGVIDLETKFSPCLRSYMQTFFIDVAMFLLFRYRKEICHRDRETGRSIRRWRCS